MPIKNDTSSVCDAIHTISLVVYSEDIVYLADHRLSAQFVIFCFNRGKNTCKNAKDKAYCLFTQLFQEAVVDGKKYLLVVNPFRYLEVTFISPCEESSSR